MKLRQYAVLSLLFVALLAACSGTSQSDAPAFQAPTAAIQKAVTWLIANHQNEDGGYTSFSTGANAAPSDAAGTLDAIIAIVAAGGNPSIAADGESVAPVDYLLANADALQTFAAENGGQAGKVLLALHAAGVDARDFGGHDYVTELTGKLDEAGAYAVADPFKQSLAILGLIAAGERPAPEAVSWLKSIQAASGSWDDGFGTVDNADATAAAVMALVAAGESSEDESVSRAVEFLASAQQADGGWSYGPGVPTSANSTALVAQALTALGENWYAEGSRWTKDATPLLALQSFQSETGAFQSDFGQGAFDDFFATVQALPALSGKPLPVPSVVGE